MTFGTGHTGDEASGDTGWYKMRWVAAYIQHSDLKKIQTARRLVGKSGVHVARQARCVGLCDYIRQAQIGKILLYLPGSAAESPSL